MHFQIVSESYGTKFQLTEEITINMPAIQILGVLLLSFSFCSAEIHDECIAPPGAFVRVYPFLSSHQLTHSIPCLGREFSDFNSGMSWHVSYFAIPRSLIVWVHAQADPNIFGEGLGLLPCKASLQTDVTMIHEMVNLISIQVREFLLLENLVHVRHDGCDGLDNWQRTTQPGTHALR